MPTATSINDWSLTNLVSTILLTRNLIANLPDLTCSYYPHHRGP